MREYSFDQIMRPYFRIVFPWGANPILRLGPVPNSRAGPTHPIAVSGKSTIRQDATGRNSIAIRRDDRIGIGYMSPEMLHYLIFSSPIYIHQSFDFRNLRGVHTEWPLPSKHSQADSRCFMIHTSSERRD